jgi:predicted regulator of Ras-like GTPase activity (Roadblock/LC7/MglB family)
MSTAAEFTRELDRLASEQGIEISAIITRSGAPIAWHLPAGLSAETIATLSATIFGASEVIFTSSGWNKPLKVSVESIMGGVMVIRSLGRKAILVLMSKSMDMAQLENKSSEAEMVIKKVMQDE